MIVDTGTPGESRAVAGRRVLARRPEGRAVDLPVARRRRPQRQPRRGMTACPNAQLVCNWAMVERHYELLRLPARPLPVGRATASRSTSATARCMPAPPCSTRRRRAVSTIRRPACTGPSTRSRRRCPTTKMAIADLDQEFWYAACAVRVGAVSPWLTMLDHDKYGGTSIGVQNLDIKTIASCHSPVIEARSSTARFERVRQLPTLDPPMRRTSRFSTRSSLLRRNRRDSAIADATLSRSGGVAEWLQARVCKTLYTGSIPVAASGAKDVSRVAVARRSDVTVE
jgi:hypothetical protein